MSNFTIRPATADDATAAIPLLLDSGRDALVWAYGLGDEERSVRFLLSAFARDDTVFSWPHAVVATDHDDNVVGLMYLHDHDSIEACSGSTIAHLFRYFGFSIGAWSYWRTIRLGRSLPEPKPGCLHISGLSVATQARGKGLFGELIELAVKGGKVKELDYLSLDVEKLNHHAHSCYESKGFVLRYTRPEPAKGLDGYRYYTRPIMAQSGEDDDDD